MPYEKDRIETHVNYREFYCEMMQQIELNTYFGSFVGYTGKKWLCCPMKEHEKAQAI